MTIALSIQTHSTAQSFLVGNWITDQTSQAISWRKIPNMSNPILIKHPLTDQWIDIDPSQEWFWTKKWQLEEREVDRELEAGRYEKFNNIDDFIESL